MVTGSRVLSGLGVESLGKIGINVCKIYHDRIRKRKSSGINNNGLQSLYNKRITITIDGA